MIVRDTLSPLTSYLLACILCYIILCVALLLTHILKGVSSVCGYVDEEDTLACVVAEVYGVIPNKSLCLVLVDGAVSGFTALVVQTRVTAGY